MSKRSFAVSLVLTALVGCQAQTPPPSTSAPADAGAASAPETTPAPSDAPTADSNETVQVTLKLPGMT